MPVCLLHRRRPLLRAALVGPALFGWLHPVGVAARQAPSGAPGPGADAVTLRLAFTVGQTFKYAFESHMGTPTAGGASQRESTVQMVYAYTVNDVQDDGTGLVSAVAERVDVTFSGMPPGFPQSVSPSLDGRAYQALVSPTGVSEQVGPGASHVTGSNLVNGFPFVGALTDTGYPDVVLSQGVPLVRERTIEDPPGGSTLSVQVAPGYERSETTLLSVNGTADGVVAAVSEHSAGSSPTRRRGNEQNSDVFDRSAEYEVLLATGLTRHARITDRIEVTSTSPSQTAPRVIVSNSTIEYRLLDAAS